MEFQHFFEIKKHLLIQAWANTKKSILHNKGLGANWSIKQWYEGVITLNKQGTQWHYFFKTDEVQNDTLPEFTYQGLFGEMGNFEVFDRLEEVSKTSEKSPFPIVEIGKNFIPISLEMPSAEDRIDRGEDSWG